MPDALEVLPEQIAFLLGTLSDQRTSEARETLRDGRLRHEVQLAHHRDLVRRVEEQVGDGQVGNGGALVGDPHPDLRRQQRRRLLNQERHRIHHHERGKTVGEVLLQLEDRFLQLGASGRRRVQIVGHDPKAVAVTRRGRSQGDCALIGADYAPHHSPSRNHRRIVQSR